MEGVGEQGVDGGFDGRREGVGLTEGRRGGEP